MYVLVKSIMINDPNIVSCGFSVAESKTISIISNHLQSYKNFLPDIGYRKIMKWENYLLFFVLVCCIMPFKQKKEDMSYEKQ